MRYEVRVSPAGDEAAIATHDPRWWRSTTDGGWIKAERVKDWTVLVPRTDVVTVSRKPGEMWQVAHNGRELSATPNLDVASYTAIQAVRGAGGTATVVYDDQDSIELRKMRRSIIIVTGV